MTRPPRVPRRLERWACANAARVTPVAGSGLFLVRAQCGVRHPAIGTPPGIQLGHQVLEGYQVLGDPGQSYGDDPVGQLAFGRMLVDQRTALLVRIRDG